MLAVERLGRDFGSARFVARRAEDGSAAVAFAAEQAAGERPASISFVGPTPAVVIGIAAGVLCFFAATSLKGALGYDDSLDAFGVHCVGGIIGALLTGAFASKEISGADGSVLTQLWGVGTTLIYGFVMSFIILKIIDMTIGLRVTEEQEREGLDISLHGERVD